MHGYQPGYHQPGCYGNAASHHVPNTAVCKPVKKEVRFAENCVDRTYVADEDYGSMFSDDGTSIMSGSYIIDPTEDINSSVV